MHCFDPIVFINAKNVIDFNRVVQIQSMVEAYSWLK